MNNNFFEINARKAILKLREEKFQKGHPFMINSYSLPTGQCWLEYPDGKIHLVTLSKSRMDFDIIRVLTDKEAKAIRKECGID